MANKTQQITSLDGITIKSISKSYGEQVVIDSLSLDFSSFDAAEIVALISVG